jgi:cytochrome c553
MPRLAGQREAYLLKAMRDYQSGARFGAGAIMPDVMSGVDEAEMQALAHYLAHLAP